MPRTSKPAGLKTKKSKGSLAPQKNVAVKVVEPPPDDSSEENDSDEEGEDGVDEEGMKRLMAALGDDGLDDYELAQLASMDGEDDENEDDEETVSNASEEEVASGDEESDAEEGEEEENDDENTEGGSDDEDSIIGSEGLEEEEEEEAVALDEVESVDEDAVPRQKIEIDNKIALDRIRDTIKLDPSLSWTETLVVTYPESITVDVEDDLKREVAFYKQALDSANTARSLAAKHNLPFTRPADYFAEMVKSDSHMERIRQRLLDESAGIQRAEEKRREREGKKFGKQVQLEKAREREKSKKDMEEKLKGLKRKRKGALENAEADDGFDVAVEDALTDRPAKRSKEGTRMPRQARDSKFGYGGPGRRAKQNTKESTDDFGGGSAGRGRGRGGGRGGRGGGRGGAGRGGAGRGSAGRGGGGRGAKRLGKSRRQAGK